MYVCGLSEINNENKNKIVEKQNNETIKFLFNENKIIKLTIKN